MIELGMSKSEISQKYLDESYTAEGTHCHSGFSENYQLKLVWKYPQLKILLLE